MAIPVAAGVWELGKLAAAGLAAVFVASPQGREAAREAARTAAEALEGLRSGAKSESDAEKRTKPVSRPVSRSCSGDCGKEMCPVCRQKPNPTPGFTPAYLIGKPRPPSDRETLPPLTSYEPTNRYIKRARVYRRPDKTYIHRDNFHVGHDAHLEVYSKNRKHMGTICPHCGAPRGGPVPGRKLIF